MATISRERFGLAEVMREVNWLAETLQARRAGLTSQQRAALLIALGSVYYFRLAGQVEPDAIDKDCKEIGTILRAQKGSG